MLRNFTSHQNKIKQFNLRDTDQNQIHKPALVTGATDAVGQGDTGKYFEHMQLRPCRFGEKSEKVEALYRACLAY